MDSCRSTHSTSTSGGEAVYPSLPVNEDSAPLGCPSPKSTADVAPELIIRRCKSEPSPCGDPSSTSLAIRALRLLSIHPASPWFPLLSLLLDLAIFYLVQAVQFTAGTSLLHALYPSEPDYAMTAARSMRIGAAGGAMFVFVVTLRSLLQLGCYDPEEDTDVPERWDSVWDAAGCLQTNRTPDVRYVAFIGVSGSVAFGRATYGMSGLLHAATAALVGYVVLSASKAALSYARRSEVSL